MGSTGALGMADAVNDGLASIDQALSWHLSSNHYPPVPSFMIPVAKAAIELANDGDWDAPVELPEFIEWRDGSRLPRVDEIVEEFHLDSFIDYFD